MLLLLAAVSCWGQAPQASVALEAPARVGLPVWLKISSPDEIRYPFYTAPDWHVCHDVEVRKDGKPFPRIQRLGSAAAMVGSIPGGLCGGLYLPGKPQHTGSIPLHVMYRFEQPGIYEVRYVEHSSLLLGDTAPPTVVSPWTPIEIQAATAADRAKWLADVSASAPTDATGLLSGYLPDILGVPDDQSLKLLVPYLNHPDAMVRQYVSRAVSYWPAEEAIKAVLAMILTQGPSEYSAGVLSVSKDKMTAVEADAAVQAALPYLKSDSAISLKGAINVVQGIALGEKSQVSGELKRRAADALVDAEAHVVALGDPEIANAYVQAVFTVKDDRASKILWSFVDRGIAHEQAVICLAWLHSPADLPKLAQMAMPPTAQPRDPGPGSLPYALRSSYGDVALPYIEEMLQRSPFVFVRTASARELVNAGRPSGFAFIVDAIEQNRTYRGEMIQFLRDRFPELRQADDAAALRLAQSKANTK
jgi:hypothetical protein